MRILASVLIALAALPGQVHATTRGRGCRQQCAPTFVDTLEQQCGTCAPDAVAARGNCAQLADLHFTTCTDACPGFPGRCTITQECVSQCRTDRAGERAACARQFKARIRSCSGGGQCLVAARKARRQCLRLCRLGVGSSASGVPPSAKAAAAAGCTCQPDCIARIVGGCYADCNDRCEGDQDALPICRRACRDAQCTQLQNTCTQGGSSSHAYEKCCTTCGNCATDVGCTPIPTTTTVSSSTTSTTTTTLAPCTVGVTCGSCGGGSCLPLCSQGCTPACVRSASPAVVCASDGDCPAGEVCVTAVSCPTNCGVGGQSVCALPCP